MEFQGSETIAAPRGRVWEAINDPNVLRQCIPGCESFDLESEGRFKAVVARKIGPVNARFSGMVELSEVVEEEGCAIRGEAAAAAAGSASGFARVSLSDAEEGTLLTWEAEAKVRGKIAQLGSRLINPLVKKTTIAFFGSFRQIVEEG